MTSLCLSRRFTENERRPHLTERGKPHDAFKPYDKRHASARVEPVALRMGKTTPYFLFVGESRADVKAALQEAGEPTSLGNVGKALGLKWKALTDEQREVS